MMVTAHGDFLQRQAASTYFGFPLAFFNRGICTLGLVSQLDTVHDLAEEYTLQFTPYQLISVSHHHVLILFQYSKH
jgi:hypothetical protein